MTLDSRLVTLDSRQFSLLADVSHDEAKMRERIIFAFASS